MMTSTAQSNLHAKLSVQIIYVFLVRIGGLKIEKSASHILVVPKEMYSLNTDCC